ncbi:hypothetical protein A3I36_00205 [Candidatus Giovannonibacteria bacterium RIFCSPLOWO2_02_FULL_45_28]|uniref:DUF1573 domain-containing protein n=1 Tax=Candidatus Giovannonibacteria bacterium RIFCSPHIGHO2_02_FULL_45_40 TaxID=1798337 RepID=A0A1F5WB33_9BACT|nr:MAG: hypothetical protein A2120_04105 [Candidatus Giovannonibacteria bacterium GWA2_45_15]OGF59533.1 MAG: hypothetical protein A2W40_02810 [Candidatus Giovannonibacteria bacterium RIFCSPHIGHO2_01_45_12]OGF61337.1 MAG: hypothetical protein A2656_00470 [Candidatus Giovannonibacteria bacterium RIFCSPHIGHO2_01_FULL_44_100]OGF72760.1 MAG: hypothetical protein A3C05_03260 [Candidatus Giovannonibacteria bacterium RIFCSPHIGHO2_02_FULL_45_40]OGF83706.1 MAG: hypothetical protein A3E63_02115 [Candidatu
MNQNKNIFLGAFVSLLILGGIVWLAKPNAPANQEANANSGSGAIAASESSFDFGGVSMAKGNVSHNFKIKNTGASNAIINKIYTSCMCTTATLKVGGEKWGPFGMPGHGFVPSLKIKLAPGAEADTEVVFDPAAHGPAGVGKIERAVIIENDAGEPLELRFTAVVTP